MAYTTIGEKKKNENVNEQETPEGEEGILCSMRAEANQDRLSSIHCHSQMKILVQWFWWFFLFRFLSSSENVTSSRPFAYSLPS